MTADESLPTYDFEIPLEIKNLEKKAEILQLWETAKNAFATNDVKKVRSDYCRLQSLMTRCMVCGIIWELPRILLVGVLTRQLN